MMPAPRFRVLYDRRVRIGNGGVDQLRLYRDKPSSPIGVLATHPLLITAILAALQASPYLLLAPLGEHGRGAP